jgi:hypothetical protein
MLEPSQAPESVRGDKLALIAQFLKAYEEFHREAEELGAIWRSMEANKPSLAVMAERVRPEVFPANPDDLAVSDRVYLGKVQEGLQALGSEIAG